jgi:hypothetical protein
MANDTASADSALDKIVITPARAASALSLLLDLNEPAMLWGPPGIGKSEILHQTCATRSWAVEKGTVRDIRVGAYEAVDFRGVPYVHGGQCHQAYPSILPREGVNPPEGVLFLDELSHASPSTQGPLLQLTLNRQIDQFPLMPGWRIIAAANDREHNSGGYKLISALSRRFVHFNLIPSFDDWKDWAIKNRIPPVVVAFLKFRPELLDKDDLREKVGPNPRSWVKAARILASGRLDPTFETEMLAGIVGRGPAGELISFVRIFRELPDPEEVVRSPLTVPVPTNVATLYAICGALAPRVTPANVASIFTYAERMPEEYRTLLFADCLRYNDTIAKTPVFKDFVHKHGDIFLLNN